jgi:hypothetical protein
MSTTFLARAFAVFLVAVAAGYFHAAWDCRQRLAAFDGVTLQAAMANVENLQEMSTLERGGAGLPFIGRPTHQAAISFHSQGWGRISGTRALPAAVLDHARHNGSIRIEYRPESPWNYRFPGLEPTPARPLTLALGLLVAAGLITWRHRQA